MSYQEQQKKVHAEIEERERRKVEDELEQQNEEAKKTSEFDEFYSLNSAPGLANALFFENANQKSSYSSLSIEYDPNRKKKQSFQTSRLTSQFDRSSLIISNPTYSDQTPIPFFDEHQGDSMLDEKRSHPVLSRQRTRNYSCVSERKQADNESTVTVKKKIRSKNVCFFFSQRNEIVSVVSSKTSYQIRTDCSTFIVERTRIDKCSIEK